MHIGVPKEIKNNEYRVAIVPSIVRELTDHGHQVFIETNAGSGVDISDSDYQESGATMLNSAQEVFDQGHLILKVKEPQPQECAYLNEEKTLFTFLHLAADKKQTELLLASNCTAIAYETVTDARGGLPLLAPMSEVAGRMSIQAGAHCLEKAQGGRGILLSGVPGVASASVVILGGGVVGSNAIRMALGLEAQVTVLDKSAAKLKELDLQFGGQLNTIFSTQDAIEKYVATGRFINRCSVSPGCGSAENCNTGFIKKNAPRFGSCGCIHRSRRMFCDKSADNTYGSYLYC